QPSAGPTEQPSAGPTEQPSAGPTEQPSAGPTEQITRAPSTRPSTASTSPSTVPTPGLSTRSPTTALQEMTFSATQSLSSVTREQFMADDQNSLGFLASAAEAMGISVGSLCCLTVTESAGVDLTYTIRMLLEGYTQADADAMYDSTTAKLTSSVDSGALQIMLDSAMSAEVVQSGFGVEPKKTFFTPVQMATLEVTMTPTIAPTIAPTASSAVLSAGSVSGSGGSLTNMTFVAGGVGAMAVLLLAIGYWFFVCRGRTTDDGDANKDKHMAHAVAEWKKATVLDLAHLELESDSESEDDLDFDVIYRLGE
ncbi:hypothetical protein B484DRAFT_404070, partial [Ochromonadaceae sp. CCMP2298]